MIFFSLTFFFLRHELPQTNYCNATVSPCRPADEIEKKDVDEEEEIEDQQ
jgi:hypothetical protein